MISDKIRQRISEECELQSPFNNGKVEVDVDYSKHYRVDHGNNESANSISHINDIEIFWSVTKRQLQKLNGVPAENFYLHLKECEWRFNDRHDNLYQELLRLLRSHLL